MSKRKQPTDEEMRSFILKGIGELDRFNSERTICEQAVAKSLRMDRKTIQQGVASPRKAIDCLNSGKALDAMYYAMKATALAMAIRATDDSIIATLAKFGMAHFNRKRGKAAKQAERIARAKEELALLLESDPRRYTAKVKEAVAHGGCGHRAFHDHLKSIGVTYDWWRRAQAVGQTKEFLAKLNPDSKARS
jgi:hypothetical protein